MIRQKDDPNIGMGKLDEAELNTKIEFTVENFDKKVTDIG